MKIRAKYPFLLLIIFVITLTFCVRSPLAYGEEADSGQTETGIGFNTNETEESTTKETESNDQPILLFENTPKKYNGVNRFPNTNDRSNGFLVLAGILLMIWVLVAATHREKVEHF